MSFLGIDLGTTFIKAAVLNLESRDLEHVRRTPFPPPLEGANPLLYEIDPEAILSAVRALIAELSPYALDCEGIVMCSQMHGMVLLNDQGKAESNCITWRDQRVLMPAPSGGGSYFDLLTRQLDLVQVRQLGNELDPGRPLCYLYWLKEQGKLTPGWTPVSVPDFVLSSLCGSSPGAEVTNAAAYSAFNLKTLSWHEDVIARLGLDTLSWPTLRRQGEVVGLLAVNGRSVPCYAPVGDYQCALVGALLREDELSLNISTGSQISRLVRECKFGDYQTRPYFDGKFLITFTALPAGRALNVLVDLLCELARAQGVELSDPWDWIVKATSKLPDTDLEVELDFFGPACLVRGQITNIRGSNLTVGHLFRAAFKQMAERNFESASRLWPEGTWQNLLFSGGLPSKLEVLREVIQRRFDSPYRIAPYSEDTLFGLLILASAFSGRSASVQTMTQEVCSSLPLFQDRATGGVA